MVAFAMYSRRDSVTKNHLRYFIYSRLIILPHRWEDPAGLVLSDVGRVKGSPDGYLSLAEAAESDAGNYTCVAENGVEQRSRSFTLQLSGQSV